MTARNDEIREWLRQQLDAVGHGAKQRLAKYLGFPRSDAITRMLNTDPTKETREIKAHELALMREFFHADTPKEHQVRLAGFVGAGQEVYQFDEDGAGFVEAPPGATDQTEAVEVRGDSMLPLYEDGTILYYSKQLSPDVMVGRRCVVRLEDERVLVKSLRRGSEKGLWTLVSLNAPDIEDVAVQWAAPIDWIKPR